MAAKDFTSVGTVFSRLTIVGAPERHDQRWYVLCRCECGTEKLLQCKHLTSGATVSCGCVRRGLPNLKNRTHGNCSGESKASPTYLSWIAAKSRCEDVKDRDYANYGGRGIKMCERWLGDFSAFLSDMGERPAGMTLDRFPNADGDYEPGNCRWATHREQQNNRRNNVLIEHNGQMKTCTQVAREYGIRPSVFIGRIRAGWSIERATSEPVGKR
jgi:hypothetical protein